MTPETPLDRYDSRPRQQAPGPGGTYVLCAGGTGGHMVPAHCLALELMARGHHVHLVTDERGLRFPGLFPGVEITRVDAASTGRSGWKSLPSVALMKMLPRAVVPVDASSRYSPLAPQEALELTHALKETLFPGLYQ